MSSTKISNIPNGFERLAQDVNISNLRTELKKLRASAKMSGAGEPDDEKPKKDAPKKVQPKAEEAKKPDPKAKGGAAGKDAKAPTQLEAPPPEEEDIVAT